MKQKKDISFEILLKNGGELTNDFEELSHVELWSVALPKSFFLKNLLNFANKAFIDKWRRWRIIRKLRNKKFDLIFANTLDTTEVIAILGPSLGIPCICHVHELEYTIRTYCGLEKFKEAQPFISKYIAVAESVKENLISRHGVLDQSIHVIPPPVDLPMLRRHLGQNEPKHYSPSEEQFTVIGSGLGGWRKGTDIFILIAKIIRDMSPLGNIKFRWVGHVEQAQMEQYIYDLDMLGLQDFIEFTGHQKDSLSFYRKADLFLLTSREDPFPLVCIESAALGKPLMSFASIGAVPHFIIENDAGSVVPYMNLDLMAAEIINFAANRALGRQKGINGSNSLQNFDVPVVGSRIYDLINTFRSVPQ